MPLRHRPFRRLWPAQICNILSYWLGDIALAVLVYDNTRSSLATAGLFLANMFLPALVSPALIARIEASSVRRSLPAIFAGQACLFGLLAILAQNFSLPLVLTLAFLVGVLGMMARTLIRSTAATILKPLGELREGNALLNISFTWAFFAGPAAAGVAVAALGPADTLLLGVGVFVVAGAVLLGVAGLPAAQPAAVAWRDRLGEGLSYVRRHEILKLLFIAVGAVIIFTDIIWPLEVVLAKGTLGGGDAAYGFFVASWGVGMAIGGLWFTAVRTARLHVLLLISLILMGVAFIGTGLAPNLAIADAAQVVGGLGNGFQWVALITIVQEMTDDAFQARVQSLLESVISSMQGVGFIAGGAIAAIFSARYGFVVAGAGTLVVATVALLSMRRLPWAAAVATPTGDEAAQPASEPIVAETRL